MGSEVHYLFKMIIDGSGFVPSDDPHGQGFPGFQGLIEGKCILRCFDRLAINALDDISPMKS